MNIIKYRTVYFIIGAILVVASIVTIAVNGLNFGIEFTGGSILEVAYETERPDIVELRNAVSVAGFDAQVQYLGDSESILLRTRELSENEKATLFDVIAPLSELEPTLVRADTVGPTIGSELRTKALIAIALVSVLIILFIAYVFRKVSKPVSAWKYGVVAILALLHDIIIPIGIFAFFGWEITSLFVVGLLSILGLSINDTIVVFDRIRENLRESYREDASHVTEDFEEIVGYSLSQTIGRSINTSLTLVFVLLALIIFGPESTQSLAIVLLIGITLGTYSSIFLASPLLVTLSNMTKKDSSSENEVVL